VRRAIARTRRPWVRHEFITGTRHESAAGRYRAIKAKRNGRRDRVTAAVRSARERGERA
jgi:hypothetical protein